VCGGPSNKVLFFNGRAHRSPPTLLLFAYYIYMYGELNKENKQKKKANVVMWPPKSL